MFIEYQISILEWFLKDHVITNVAVFTAFFYQINAFLEKKLIEPRLFKCSLYYCSLFHFLNKGVFLWHSKSKFSLVLLKLWYHDIKGYMYKELDYVPVPFLPLWFWWLNNHPSTACRTCAHIPDQWSTAKEQPAPKLQLITQATTENSVNIYFH